MEDLTDRCGALLFLFVPCVFAFRFVSFVSSFCCGGGVLCRIRRSIASTGLNTVADDCKSERAV